MWHVAATCIPARQIVNYALFLHITKLPIYGCNWKPTFHMQHQIHQVY